MKKIYSLIALALCACTVPFSSCSDDDDDDSNVGSTFEVTLKCTPSTGYGWIWTNKEEAAADSIGFELVSLNFDGTPTPTDSSDIVGGSANEVFKFRVKKQGCDSLVFKYMRSWEDSVLDTYVYHFKK